MANSLINILLMFLEYKILNASIKSNQISTENGVTV
jgi:hypothetical protein